MIEIKPSDLQPNQTYYIEMSNTLSIISNKKKLKAIFYKIVPGNGYNPEYAMFDGGCNFMNFRSYKYYLPTRDAILKKREKDVVNSILQQITGDPCFKYYL
jgi:hypothetical protein